MKKFIKACCADTNFQLLIKPLSPKDRKMHRRRYDKLKTYKDKLAYTLTTGSMDIQWISARGLYDSSILTYEEHVRESKKPSPDWNKINHLIRSFCITGGFTIEYALKNYLLDKSRIAGEPSKAKIQHNMREMNTVLEDCSHDMIKLFNIVHEHDNLLMEDMVKFTDKHKKSIKRIRYLSFEELICGKLSDFGNSLIRYGRQLHRHDVTPVLMFMVFLDNRGLIDIPSSKGIPPFTKEEKEYIKLEDISDNYKKDYNDK